MLLSAGTLAWVASAAQAQEAPASSGGLDDIVVTAQKKSERLQDVPLSVSAFGSDFLTKGRVDNVGELSAVTPNFRFNQFSVGRVDIFIRGIGSDFGSIGSDNSVGSFIDDVYVTRGSGVAANIFDLERVEIIRGPAGALYGKNTIGGAINFITNKPSQKEDAQLRIDVGNYRFLSAAGFINAPLTDTIAGRLAFSAQGRNGYAFNTFTGHDVENDNNLNVRGSILADDGGSLRVLLTGDFGRRRATGGWRHQQPVTPRNLPFVSPDPRRGASNDDGRQTADNAGISLRLDYESSIGDLTSISAYRYNAYSYLENVSGFYVSLTNPPRPDLAKPNPDLLFFNDVNEKSRAWSQEFRLANKAFDDKLEYTIGVYGLLEKAKLFDSTRFIFPDLNNFVGGETGDMDQTVKTFSAFAEATYHPVSTIDITAGLRWSHDDKDFKITKGGIPTTRVYNTPTGAGFTVGRDASWSAFTPRVSVKWHPTSTQTYYAAVSRGYKSGAFDGSRATSPQAAQTPVDPEFAWNYEIGAKTEWFDRRLRLNLTAFYTDYTDLQTQQLLLIDPAIPPQRILVNAGKVVSKGIEVEASLAVAGPFRIDANYGYLHSRFASDLIVNNVNLKGFHTRRSPEHQGSISLNMDQEFASGARLTGRASYEYTSSFFFDNNNSPVTRVHSYELVNANLDFTPAGSSWTFSLWGKNLTDELYVRHTTAVFNTGYVLYGAPRTYGVAVTWKMGGGR
ncbi:TonB-dependent receptor [Rhizorhabdus histidinilytica]